jgi:hypothetical protein
MYGRAEIREISGVVNDFTNPWNNSGRIKIVGNQVIDVFIAPIETQTIQTKPFPDARGWDVLSVLRCEV